MRWIERSLVLTALGWLVGAGIATRAAWRPQIDGP